MTVCDSDANVLSEFNLRKEPENENELEMVLREIKTLV